MFILFNARKPKRVMKQGRFGWKDFFSFRILIMMSRDDGRSWWRKTITWWWNDNIKSFMAKLKHEKREEDEKINICVSKKRGKSPKKSKSFLKIIKIF